MIRGNFQIVTNFSLTYKGSIRNGSIYYFFIQSEFYRTLASSVNKNNRLKCRNLKFLMSNNQSDKLSNTEFPWDFSILKDHLQSPVDIITSMAVKQNLDPLSFTAVNDKKIVCIVKNSGHGVTIKLESSDERIQPRLQGAFLRDKYLFENLHFHWGKEDYFGSEHFINSESFSFEGHMVMYKKEYGDINRALMYKDGVVVLTFFAKVGKENKYLNRLLQYIPEIVNNTSPGVRAYSADPILWFLPDVVKANKISDYYVYPGSLTTPPFTESVTFILLPENIFISHSQLAQLRQLENDKSKPTKTNRRELQPIRGRPLIRANVIQWQIKSKKGNLIEESSCCGRRKCKR